MRELAQEGAIDVIGGMKSGRLIAASTRRNPVDVVVGQKRGQHQDGDQLKLCAIGLAGHAFRHRMQVQAKIAHDKNHGGLNDHYGVETEIGLSGRGGEKGQMLQDTGICGGHGTLAGAAWPEASFGR